MTIEAIRRSVRKALSTPGYGGKDPRQLIRALGIFWDQQDLHFSFGYYRGYCHPGTSQSGPFIVTDIHLSYEEETQVLWHELAHLLLEHNDLCAYREIDFFFSSNVLEKEANLWSAEAQLRDEEVLTYLRDGYCIDETAAILGVPRQVMYFKLRMMHSLGLIPAEDLPEVSSSYMKDGIFS